ncbi:MAG: hypothetical protein Ta2A_10950 [Treponemataceae bacterium]|nr:MAG: hypothetical protein Ta2A_10950 [Treponemataceae bacterium]
MDLFPLIMIAVGLVILVVVVMLIFALQKKQKSQPTEKSQVWQKKRSTIIRDATRKLAQNPYHVAGLEALADLYYEEHEWEKAYPVLNTLVELLPAHPEINVAEIGLRQGITALKLDRANEALRGLSLSIVVQP